jgi:hypothetical protein
MPRPRPETVTQKTLYDQDYLVFMASLLIQDPVLLHRFQSGMALIGTWFDITSPRIRPEGNDTLLAHIKLQWWADTPAAGQYQDHPLLAEAPADLLKNTTTECILQSFRSYLEYPPLTQRDWIPHLDETFGAMGKIIYGQDMFEFSTFGAQKHAMRGDGPVDISTRWPKKTSGDLGIMARVVRAVGKTPKNPKSPWALLKVWCGV